ncbi:hypothetical protein WR25_24860 [Diploscapter pachys]|uniref:Uncharacterized protein n=1 Tax=Diploscapter pachys TaxID=2018661 RepID=A0A2A2L4H5_9BILA|nr:hypothetical protein WR25_24860 [Diploscapter pachys]
MTVIFSLSPIKSTASRRKAILTIVPRTCRETWSLFHVRVLRAQSKSIQACRYSARAEKADDGSWSGSRTCHPLHCITQLVYVQNLLEHFHESETVA